MILSGYRREAGRTARSGGGVVSNYQPRKRTLEPGPWVCSSLIKTRAVGRGPLVVMAGERGWKCRWGGTQGGGGGVGGNKVEQGRRNT